MIEDGLSRGKVYEAVLRRGWGTSFTGYYKPKLEGAPVLILIEPRTLAERLSLESALAAAQREHCDATVCVCRRKGKWRLARHR